MAADTLLGDFRGFLVTDDFGGYNRVENERRQLCRPHLIRKFIDISERVGNGGKIGNSSYHLIRAACEENLATSKVSTRFVFDPPGLMPQA